MKEAEDPTKTAASTEDDGPPLPENVAPESLEPPPRPNRLKVQSVGVWKGKQAPTPSVSKRLHLTPGRPLGLIGYAGSGKTLLAADLGVAVASPEGFRAPAWGGVPIDRHGPVLHIDLEVGEYLTRQRYTRIAEGRGLTIEALEETLFWTCDSRLSLQDDEAEAMLIEAMEGFTLCIIDSLAKLLGGFNENDNTGISHLMGKLQRASEATGCALVVLHHEGKPPQDGSTREARYRGRGASGIQGEWSSMWVVDSKGEGQLVLEHGKSQWGNPRESWSCRIVDVGEKDPETDQTPGVLLSCLTDSGETMTPEVVEGGAIERAKQAILGLLRALGVMNVTELLGKVKVNKDAKYKALEELKRDGRVEQARLGKTRWLGLPDSHFPEGAVVERGSEGSDDFSRGSRRGGER